MCCSDHALRRAATIAASAKTQQTLRSQLRESVSIAILEAAEDLIKEAME